MRPPGKYDCLRAQHDHHHTVASIRGPEAPRVWVCPICGEKVARVDLVFGPDVPPLEITPEQWAATRRI